MLQLTYYDPDTGLKRMKRRYVWGITGFACGVFLGGCSVAMVIKSSAAEMPEAGYGGYYAAKAHGRTKGN